MIEKAKDHFGSDFEALFDYYLEYGIVYSDQETFTMAVIHDKDYLLGKKSEKEIDKRDCYYVHYHAGDLKRLFDIMPEPMEWVVFDRITDQPMKCYNIERIRRLIYGKKKR
jgi:hypothetical protein